MTGPQQLICRPAEPADEPFLRTLFTESRPEFAHLPEPVRSQLLDLQFRAQRDHYRSDCPEAVEQLIELAGEPIGRCWAWAGPDAHRLLDITIDSRHRGRGVGSLVLAQLQAEAARSAVPLLLHVWNQNISAIRLYERLGFSPTGESNGYLALQWNPEK